jgi:hypothetical protein
MADAFDVGTASFA